MKEWNLSCSIESFEQLELLPLLEGEQWHWKQNGSGRLFHTRTAATVKACSPNRLTFCSRPYERCRQRRSQVASRVLVRSKFVLSSEILWTLTMQIFEHNECQSEIIMCPGTHNSQSSDLILSYFLMGWLKGWRLFSQASTLNYMINDPSCDQMVD